jgi:hypothetical protein
MYRQFELSLTQPLVRRREIPSEDCKDGHRAKDDTGKVERSSRHGKVERRDHHLNRVIYMCPVHKKKKVKVNTHGKGESVEQHRGKVHWPSPTSEVKTRRLESVRGQREAQQGDEPICCDGRHDPSRG